MQVLRGPLLNPQSAAQCDFYPDGGLLVGDSGLIEQVGPFEEVARTVRGQMIKTIKVTVLDSGEILVPGFVDAHVHMPQHDVRGEFRKDLMPWLREYIWPQERKFEDPAFANEKAAEFFKDMVAQGTLLSQVMGSIHEGALEAIFSKQVGHVLAGNVLMDTGCEESGLQQSTAEAIALMERMSALHGEKYVITPRFLPTCTMELLRACGALAARTRQRVHTHLCESPGEIELVMAEAKQHGYSSYTDAYSQAGLLGPRSVMAHCVHMSPDELRLLQQTGTGVAHCPESNDNLNSGRMQAETLMEMGIPFGLGSDEGAGSTLAMPYHMKRYMEAQGDWAPLTGADVIFRASLAGAQILGMDQVTGNLNPGKEANVVILNIGARPRSVEEAVEAMIAGSKDEIERRVRRTIFQGKAVFEREAA